MLPSKQAMFWRSLAGTYGCYVDKGDWNGKSVGVIVLCTE
jgi:hypothetical protein